MANQDHAIAALLERISPANLYVRYHRNGFSTSKLNLIRRYMRRERVMCYLCNVKDRLVGGRFCRPCSDKMEIAEAKIKLVSLVPHTQADHKDTLREII